MVAKVTTRQLQAVGILVKEGLASSGAIAIIGNYSWESGGPNLPTTFRTRNLDHGSNGLAQWRLGRLTKYMQFVAWKQPQLDQDDYTPQGDLWPFFGRLDYQLQFTVEELRNDYPNLYAKLCKGGNIASLTADICWQYERPNRSMAHLDQRIAYSRAISAAVAKTPIKLDLHTTLSAQAVAHDQATAVAGGMVAVPTLALATGGAVAAAPEHFHWYVWVFVVACALAIVAGVIGFLKSHAAAATIRAAGADVIPDAKPAVAPVAVAPPKPATPSQFNPNTSKARDEEKAALADALK